MTYREYAKIFLGYKSKCKIMLWEMLFIAFLNGVKNKLLRSLLNSGLRVDSILRYYYSVYKQTLQR